MMVRSWAAGTSAGEGQSDQVRPVGLDLSERQLEHARRLMAEAGVDFPLVQASAEEVPLPDASFDIVFCDYGAMTFGDPYATVPEAARLLRREVDGTNVIVLHLGNGASACAVQDGRSIDTSMGFTS